MSTTPLPPRPSGTSRRSLLGASLAGVGLVPVALAGCDDSRSDSPGAPGVSGGPPASGNGGDDARLVDMVQQHLRQAEALVREAAATFPALTAPLRPLRRLHAGHLAELATDSEPSAPPTAGGGSPGHDATTALAAVRAHEQRLHRTLVDAAVDAGSGSLARLLACMSAGLTQALVTLPSTPPAGAGTA